MLCKNKQEYLQELSSELKGYFKKKDVQNIISDYDEFFDAGISEGKSEAEICEEFGDIKNLAREIADNQTDVKQLNKISEYVLILVLAAAVIFLYWLADYETIRDLNIYNSLFFMPFFAPVLILLFMQSYKKHEIKLDERILFFIAFVPVMIELINIVFISSRLEILFFTRTSLLFIIAVYIIFNLRKDKIEYINFLAVLYILTGAYLTFNAVLYQLARLNEPGSFIYYIAQSFVPMLISILIAAVLSIFSFWRKYLPNFNIPTFKIKLEKKERDK
jgi:uncharacterized membrane protein